MRGLARHQLAHRILGYDLARAFAVLGMVVVNFKTVMGAEENGPAWLVSLAGLLEGRAAATFVVLAGVGISLLSREGRVRADRDLLALHRRTLLKRALFLFVVGSLYTPIWPADILHFYGIYIAVAALLLTAPARQLWVLIAALVLGYCGLLGVLDYDVGWDFRTLTYDGLWTPAGSIRHLFFNGFHPVVPWLAFLLLGMVLGRQDMSCQRVRRSILGWGAGIGVATELSSRLLVRLLPGEDIALILGVEMMPPLPLYMIAGGSTACAVIAASVALGERAGTSAWIRPLVSTGQLALTLYVAHVIVGMGMLIAIGRFTDQSLSFSLLASAVFCAAGIGFSVLWRRRFSRGPLEAIMRAMTEPRPRSAR